jgi:hypothetical protein
MKNVTIILRQQDNEMIFSTAIESEKITTISGTLANRILKISDFSKNHKVDTGIKFSRKFNVEFRIENNFEQSENFLLNQLFRTNVTTNNKDNFINFVNDVVNELLIGDFLAEVDINELLEK